MIQRGYKQGIMHQKFKVACGWVKNRRCISGCVPTTTPYNEEHKEALVANLYPCFVLNAGGCPRVTNNSRIYSSSKGSVCSNCNVLPAEAGLEPEQPGLAPQSPQACCCQQCSVGKKITVFIFVSLANDDNNCIQRCTTAACSQG